MLLLKITIIFFWKFSFKNYNHIDSSERWYGRKSSFKKNNNNLQNEVFTIQFHWCCFFHSTTWFSTILVLAKRIVLKCILELEKHFLFHRNKFVQYDGNVKYFWMLRFFFIPHVGMKQLLFNRKDRIPYHRLQIQLMIPSFSLL